MLGRYVRIVQACNDNALPDPVSDPRAADRDVNTRPVQALPLGCLVRGLLRPANVVRMLDQHRPIPAMGGD